MSEIKVNKGYLGMGANLPDPIRNRFYHTNSINKKDYYLQDEYNPVTPVSQLTAVFNGGFMPQAIEQTYRGVALNVPQDIGNVAIMEGASIKKHGMEELLVRTMRTPLDMIDSTKTLEMGLTAFSRKIGRIERDILRISEGEYAKVNQMYGDKLVNFGLYMADVSKNAIKERQEEHPVTNKAAMFAGDVASSLILSLGLSAVGGPEFAAGVFSVQSGASVGANAVLAGTDVDTAFAWSVFTGVVVNEAEKFGLMKVFDKTVKKGLSVVSKHILSTVVAEGGTEAFQTAIELVAGKATGAQKGLTFLSFLSQVIYAGAVGAFSGGGMVSAVAIPQRAQAIRHTMFRFKADRAKATKMVDHAMQKAQVKILDTMGEEAGFGDVVNQTYTELRDIADLASHGRAISSSDLEDAQQRYKESQDPLTSMLNQIHEESVSEVNKEQAQKPPTSKVRGGEKAQKAQTTIDETEKLTEKLTEKIGSELPDYEPVVSKISGKLGSTYKKVVRGRLRYIREKTTALRKQIFTLMKVRKARNYKGSKNVPNKTLQKLSEKYVQLFVEYAAITQDPNGVHIDGKSNITIPAKMIEQVVANHIDQLLANVDSNFRLGKKMVKDEFKFIKTVLQTLINRPELSLNQRRQLFGRLKNVNSATQLEKRLPDIRKLVQNMIDENYKGIFQKSIDSAIATMKVGERKTRKKGKLPYQSQKIANYFLEAMREKDLNTRKEADNLGDAKGTMRVFAAMLKTGKNKYGQDMTVRDYAWVEKQLRRFVEQGRLASITENKVKAEETKRQIDRSVSELRQTEPRAKTDMGRFFEGVTNHLLALTGNYNTFIGSLVRGLSNETGSSFFKHAMDVFPSLRIAEAHRSYFEGLLDTAGKEIFNLKNNYLLFKKLAFDSYDMITLTDESGKVIWDKNCAVTRDKYMVWLSPEGKEALNWSDEFAQQIEDSLTISDVKYIHAQLEIYNQMYEQVNKIYRKKNGVDLPRRDFYSPILREGFDIKNESMESLVIGAQPKGKSGDPSYLKRQVGSDKPLIDIADFNKTNRYIRDMSYYIGMSETMDRVQTITNNHRVRAEIERIHGKSFYKNMKRFVDVLARNSTYTEGSDLTPYFNKAITNFNKMQFAIKPVLFFKQLTSGFAAMDIVSVGDYFTSLMDIPKAMEDGRLSEFLNDPYFAERGKRRGISRDLREITEEYGDMIGTRKTLKQSLRDITFNNYMYRLTQMGDMAGVIMNGWAVYQHNLKTMSPAQAKVEAIKHINSSQQSADYSEMTTAALSRNPITRALTAFTHTPLQYVNKILGELVNIGTYNFNAKKFARTYFIYGVLLNSLFALVSSGMRIDKDDTLDYIAKTAIGPFDRAYILGPILNWAVSNATWASYSVLDPKNMRELNKPRGMSTRDIQLGLFSSMFKNINDVWREMEKLGDGDGITMFEFFNALTNLAEATAPIGGVYSGGVRAVSNAVAGVVGAVEENAEGSFVNSWRRLLMVAGYSSYATREKGE